MVAGANLITAPEQHLGTMKGGVISPTSTCHTFDASAGGNGKTPGITQPSISLQEGVIKRRMLQLVFDLKIPIMLNATEMVSQKKKKQEYSSPSLDKMTRLLATLSNFARKRPGTTGGDPLEVEVSGRCVSPREAFADQSVQNQSHILTGLEASGIGKLLDKGFDVNHRTMQDPRASLLSAALLAGQDHSGSAKGNPSTAVEGLIAASWYKALSSKMAEMLAAEADADSLQCAVLHMIRRRFCNLLLLPLEQIDDNKALSQFGVDSMIGAEVQNMDLECFLG
ncbi:hypothetical protein F5Y18DRAFT_436522 [Xylariaceae sp. FL1019]|nr:hypothetical protein F5Y18DRAFT_436522 [Xylariaceae sp. FL1019]